MKRFVADCSLTLAWCMKDEHDAYADAALGLLADGEAVVPSLWALEAANALLSAERRGRMTAADTARATTLLLSLPISVDGSTQECALHDVLDLARGEGLTSYDAAYLELAMREGLPLASLDEKMKAAARKVGVMALAVP